MSDVERAVRERLARAAEALETLDGELTAIRVYAGEEDWDFPTEVRSVIECVRALAALDETGAVDVPPEVLRLPSGDRRSLTVVMAFGASWPLLYLS